MDIGRPQRIIEVEPAIPPLPDPSPPVFEPGPTIPETLPEPAHLPES